MTALISSEFDGVNQFLRDQLHEKALTIDDISAMKTDFAELQREVADLAAKLQQTSTKVQESKARTFNTAKDILALEESKKNIVYVIASIQRLIMLGKPNKSTHPSILFLSL